MQTETETQRPRDSEMGTHTQTDRKAEKGKTERQGGGTERQTEMQTEKEMARETGQLRQETE